MAKRGPMQIAKFEERLNQSDALVKALINAIDGDPKRGIKGLAPLVQEFIPRLETQSEKVEELERWRQKLEERQGGFFIKFANVFTVGLQVVGGLGVIAAIFIAITQLIDWLSKQGIIK